MKNELRKQDYILECVGISKAFGGTQALDDVQLKVRKGEVHALMGENGAGKSTLMKIIIGLHKADKGSIKFEGEDYSVHGPAQAIEYGVTMIHQELNPEPYLTIAESIFLNREDTYGRTPFLKKSETNRRAAKILDDFNFKASPTTLMENLTLAQVQMIEIIKAVSCNARLIIMDEPTSSLDSEETQRLFKTIQDLKEKGVSIIYISHRMEEIYEISDSVSIFRDGRYIDSHDIEDVCKDDLISQMVGRKVESIFPKVDCNIGDVVLKVEKLCGSGFNDISFEVREGEILGISGLVGSGRSETVRAIFGLDKYESGSIHMEGKKLNIQKPRDAINKGICMVNEDRKDYGLCLFRSIRENIALPNLPTDQRTLLINKKKEKKATKRDSKTAYCEGVEYRIRSILIKWG